MQISPTASFFNALSSLPAQAGVTQPTKPPAAAQPPALAAAAKALAARDTVPQTVATAPSTPPANGGAPKNLPRGSVVNIVV